MRGRGGRGKHRRMGVGETDEVEIKMDNGRWRCHGLGLIGAGASRRITSLGQGRRRGGLGTAPDRASRPSLARGR